MTVRSTSHLNAKKFPALDDFRLIAVVLVVANHTRSADGEFLWLLTVLRRVAVPFFIMVSGYFLACGNWRSTGKFLTKTAMLYGVGVLLYLPLNYYAGQLSPDFFRRVIFDGSFYHLWYLPALLLGTPIAYYLSRFKPQAAIPIAGALYLIGLGGESYYGLVSGSPVLSTVYNGIFQVFDYTRNGLFYVPLFLLMGAAGIVFSRRTSVIGLLCSLAALIVEALLLHRSGIQRHDSMYFFFPFLMIFLFSLLLEANQGERRSLRQLTTVVYLIHPWCLVLVRGAAKVIGLTGLLVENTVVLFILVLVSSFLLSQIILLLQPPRPVQTGRAWIELDRAALCHNVQQLRSILPEGCALMPAVKANAYGHGAVLIAKELNRLGIMAFCVATVTEGAELRRGGIKGEILVLGYTHPEQFYMLRRYRLTQTVVDIPYARLLNTYGKKLKVHLKIDTGMHRLGIPADRKEEVAHVFHYRNLVITGIFTHLCAADVRTAEQEKFTMGQAAAFDRVICDLNQRGLNCGKIHLLSSDGLLQYPELAGDYARVGIALYGVLSQGADMESCRIDLRPVLSVKARVALVKDLYAGETAGYGLGYRAERDRKIAVLSIGYADGIPRALSCGKGRVLIAGSEAPIIGLICMDQMLVDVTDIPDAAAGDTAVLIGTSGSRKISACDLAEQTETITNEILSRLGNRLNRIII